MASIMSSAFTRPSTMCSRFFASLRRYSVRRRTTSRWCSTYTSSAALEVEQAGHAVDQREHVHREARLHRGVLVELVEHHLRVRVALEVDDETDAAGARRRVAHVADALDLALVDELGDLLADHLDRGLVGHLADDDAHVAAAVLLDLGHRAELDRAATGGVRVVDPAAAEDLGAGREVGALHELHQVFDRRVGVVDQVQRGVDHLTQVVRRDVGGHARRRCRREPLTSRLGKRAGSTIGCSVVPS